MALSAVFCALRAGFSIATRSVIRELGLARRYGLRHGTCGGDEIAIPDDHR
jgi:hypothetical protein